jgi:hypothetical protein
MNIVIGKIGKSILFDYNKWGMTGGEQEAPVYIASLAQMNPNINFYLIGLNDFEKLDANIKNKININKNIINIWKDYNNSICEKYKWPVEYFKRNKIDVDFGILYAGLHSNRNIPGITYKENGKIFDNPLEMILNYTTQIFNFINETQFPYVVIGEDYRYLPIKSLDLLRRPNEYIGTFPLENIKITIVKEILSKEKISKYENISSGNLDKVFLMGEEFPKNKINKRTELLSIYSNYTKYGINKKPIVDSWIIDIFDKKEWKVYGDWENIDLLKNKENFIKIPIHKLQSQMNNCKYTFMIPIVKNTISSKFWKLIYFGIIPFMHPFYDGKKLQIKDKYLNEILRPQTPKEFKKNIDFLENNPKEYEKVFELLQNEFKEAFFDGSLINNEFFDIIERNSNIKIEKYRENTKPIKYKMSSLFLNKNKPSRSLF